MSFVATAESVIQCGARPVFADIDPATGTLDPGAGAAAITPNTRAIVPVHLYGRSAAMKELLELGASRGVQVVQDAAQAHGMREAGTLGDAAAFSFHPTKNLAACGDAGAVASKDPEKVERVRRLRNHGQSAHQRHEEIGDTARMDSLQAAALQLRLKRLDAWNEARARLARRYRAGLGDGVEIPSESPPGEDAHHLFVIRHPRRDDLARSLESGGIGTAVHYPRPLHLQPALADAGYSRGDFPVAERWARENLSLPLYPDLTDDQVDRVCAAVREFCETAPDL